MNRFTTHLFPLCLIFVLLLTLFPGCGKSMYNLPEKMETAHFVAYCSPEDTDHVQICLDALEDRYDELLTAFGVTFLEKPTIYFHTDEEIFQSAMQDEGAPEGYEVPYWVAGMAFPDGHRIHFRANQVFRKDSTDEIISSSAVHEFIHLILYEINESIPDYLNEGIASYMSGQKEFLNVEAYMYQAYNVDLIPTVREFRLMNLGNSGEHGGLYQFSYSYVEYVVETYGFDKLLSLIPLQDISYPTEFGVTEQEFHDGWIAFVRDHY